MLKFEVFVVTSVLGFLHCLTEMNLCFILPADNSITFNLCSHYTPACTLKSKFMGFTSLDDMMVNNSDTTDNSTHTKPKYENIANRPVH